MTIVYAMMTEAELKRVDATRRRGWFARAYAWIGASRLGLFISRNVFWSLDPWLLRVTRGRFSMALVIRTGLLETRGARTGAARRNAVIYFNDDDRVVIAASQAGAATNPAWYYNLVADPDVVFAGVPMRAAVVTDEAERERLWSLADRVFPPFAKFRRRATRSGRTIPLIQLTPR
jgi:deazaflavin-dependent oxidoreductase (nitroreductase family)